MCVCVCAAFVTVFMSHYSKSQLPTSPFLQHIIEFNIAGGSSPHACTRAQIELLFKNSLLFTISIPFVGDSSKRIKSGNYCPPRRRGRTSASIRKGLSAQYKISDQNTRVDPFRIQHKIIHRRAVRNLAVTRSSFACSIIL